ncbi:MAG: flavodoxin [Lachnospiraceae bacterium]|mgnify:CR=1 FL=1|nr:flavodoxin [Lachnospiraceae bacterium]
MKAIIIYHSETGFTKQYAQWIAEETGADCLTLSAAKKQYLDQYDTILFGSFAYAGAIRKLGFFKDILKKWPDKKLILFCTGANPTDSPQIQSFFKENLKDPAFRKVNAFYCPGGLNYEKMPFLSKLMMRALLKSLRAKKDKTETDQEMIKMVSGSYDISDKKYIEPILACLK